MPGSPGGRPDGRARRLAVFVHGYSCSPRHWCGAEERLGGAIDVEVIALPGHGGAPVPAGTALGVEACVDHVLGWVGATDRHGVWLIGHSLGGMIGLTCVRRRPELFAGLVLVDAFPRLGVPPPFDKSFWSGSPADLKGRIVREMMDTRRKLPSSLWESVVAFDAGPHLADIGLPVHGMYGDRGEGDHGRLRAAVLGTGLGRIPDLHLTMVPQAGHFVMLEQPDAVYGLLAQILPDRCGG